MKKMFSDVTIWELWKALIKPTTQIGSSEIICRIDAQLVLLKFADGMIHEGDTKDLDGLNLKYFIPTFTDMVKVTIAPLFVQSDCLTMEGIAGITSSLRLHFDIFEHGLNTSTNPLSATDASQLAGTLVGRNYGEHY